MKTSCVSCQGCGAALTVTETIRYATCSHCGARLEVMRDATVIHTRVMREPVAQIGGIRDEVRLLRLQGELERYDRAWEIQRLREKIGDDVDLSFVPFIGVFGLIMVPLVVVAVNSSAGGPVVGGFLLMGVILVATMKSHREKWDDYKRGRLAITRRIFELRNPGVARLGSGRPVRPEPIRPGMPPRRENGD